MKKLSKDETISLPEKNLLEIDRIIEASGRYIKGIRKEVEELLIKDLRKKIQE